MAQSSARGQITLIAWTYAIYGLLLAAACFARAQIGPAQLSPADAFLPGLLIAAAMGAILRRPWGRYLCYIFSVLILPGAPLGTIMGGLMIYHLTAHRRQFRRPLPNAAGDR